MDRPKDGNAVVALGACAFMGYILLILLKYIMYEHGSVFNNILLTGSILCTRYYLCANGESLRTHEKACLALFVMYDRDLLDFFNVFLLAGVACIREQLRHAPAIQELVTFGCGLLFLLMGWMSVGRVLIIYNFSVIMAIAVLALIVMIRMAFNSKDNDYDEWEDVN